MTEVEVLKRLQAIRLDLNTIIEHSKGYNHETRWLLERALYQLDHVSDRIMEGEA